LFRRRLEPRRALAELWTSREIVVSLAQRDFLVRYKQALLGVLWAVFTPVALMLVLTLVFERVAAVDTSGAPYALFVYLGLLPWTFFSTSLNQGSLSLETNRSLLNRVSFPREVFPLVSVGVAGVDMAVAATVLAVLFPLYGFAPALTSLWVPLLLVIQVAFTVGVALLASAVVVHARDVRHAVPILLQIGLFATPVAYGIEAVPDSVRLGYAVLNPLGPVIDGYRRTVLLGSTPQWDLVGAAALGAAAVLAASYALFKRHEPGLADNA
jgi:ABC-type polysaccharide/polyol phosphate export permease